MKTLLIPFFGLTAPSRRMSTEVFARPICFLSYILCIFATIFPVVPCWGYKAHVIGVREGPAVRVAHEGNPENVYLYGVRVQGKDQPFGQKAYQFLVSLLEYREVEITPVEAGGDGRILAIISFDGQSLNRKIIALGLGWVDALNCSRPECREWSEVQKRIETAGRGLWSLTPVGPSGKPKYIKIELKCRKCGRIHKFYVRFSKDPRFIAFARNGGYVSLPETDSTACDCGAALDLTEIKKEIGVIRRMNE